MADLSLGLLVCLGMHHFPYHLIARSNYITEQICPLVIACLRANVQHTIKWQHLWRTLVLLTFFDSVNGRCVLLLTFQFIFVKFLLTFINIFSHFPKVSYVFCVSKSGNMFDAVLFWTHCPKRNNTCDQSWWKSRAYSSGVPIILINIKRRYIMLSCHQNTE